MAQNAPASTTTTTATTAPADPYKSSTFIGHSLWMCPSRSSPAHQAYRDIIGSTAREWGTFPFVPHITLVAALLTGEHDVVQRTRQLAAQLAPYQFELDKISARNAYFQCVYATLKLTDSVVAANAVAREQFPERQSDPPYMPHLSLVYGDFNNTVKQNTMIPQLTARMEERANETRIIPVDAIEVWSTQGDVKEWYLVEKIPLTGGMLASSSGATLG